jgi:hypothetical protein
MPTIAQQTLYSVDEGEMLAWVRSLLREGSRPQAFLISEDVSELPIGDFPAPQRTKINWQNRGPLGPRCPNITLVYPGTSLKCDSVEASRGKCGFNAFTTSPPQPIVKVYRHRKTTRNNYSINTYTQSSGSCGSCGYACSDSTETTDAPITDEQFNASCQQGAGVTTGTRVTNHCCNMGSLGGDGSCACPRSGCCTTTYNYATNTTTTCSPGSDPCRSMTYSCGGGGPFNCPSCGFDQGGGGGCNINNSCSSNPGSSHTTTEDRDYTESHNTIHCTGHAGGCTTTTDSNSSNSTEVQLSDEYTTADLTSNTIAALPAYSGAFLNAIFPPPSSQCCCSGVNSGIGQYCYCYSLRSLSSNERNLTIRRVKFIVNKGTTSTLLVYWDIYFRPEGTMSDSPSSSGSGLPNVEQTLNEPSSNGIYFIRNLQSQYRFDFADPGFDFDLTWKEHVVPESGAPYDILKSAHYTTGSAAVLGPYTPTLGANTTTIANIVCTPSA